MSRSRYVLEESPPDVVHEDPIVVVDDSKWHYGKGLDSGHNATLLNRAKMMFLAGCSYPEIQQVTDLPVAVYNSHKEVWSQMNKVATSEAVKSCIVERVSVRCDRVVSGVLDTLERSLDHLNNTGVVLEVKDMSVLSNVLLNLWKVSQIEKGEVTERIEVSSPEEAMDMLRRRSAEFSRRYGEVIDISFDDIDSGG